MKYSRRATIKAGGVIMGGIGLSGCLGSDEDYPSQDIDWIVIFGAGGGGDVHTRAVAERFPEHLPNDVDAPVRNVTGGGGMVGATEIYHSDPDGYTLGSIHGPITSAMQVLEEPDYDVRNFTPVGRTATVPHILCVSSEFEHQTLEELQNADDPISLAVTGLGDQVLTLTAANILDIEIEHVTGYDGSGDAVAGLLRGDVDAVQFNAILPILIDGYEDGDITPVIIYTDQAPDHFPDVLTADEAGYDDLVDTIAWAHDIVLPPGTEEEHPDRVEIIRSAFDDTMNSDDLQSWAEENDQAMANADPATMAQAYETWLSSYEDIEDELREAL